MPDSRYTQYQFWITPQGKLAFYSYLQEAINPTIEAATRTTSSPAACRLLTNRCRRPPRSHLTAAAGLLNDRNHGLGRHERFSLQFWFKAVEPEAADRKQLLFS